MNTINQIYNNTHRHQMMKDAEHARIGQEHRSSDHHLLRSLGRQLVKIGEQLQGEETQPIRDLQPKRS
ncbi:MAG: hypothetical protein MUF87_04165 [Anaerolineae bacterium]|jgi:hypothetical protein|nr:hypothetical protein [Anaerolineae bacterium]